VIKMYGGCFGVFMKMLEEEKETWNMHNVSRREFPKDDELSLYDGFVIIGGCSVLMEIRNEYVTLSH